MKSLRIILSIIFLSIFATDNAYCQSVDHWETVVFSNDTWRYFVGISEPNTNWRLLTFDDTDWALGQGGFGYSDNDDFTIIPQCTSVYLRRKFNVADTAAIAEALFNMDYDDAFVAYMNNVEIARAGISGVHP